MTWRLRLVTTWPQLGHNLVTTWSQVPGGKFPWPRLTDQPRVRGRELRRWELFFLSLACPRTRSWAVLVRSCARLAYVISANFLECRGVNLDINAVQERLRRVWREFGGTVGRRDRNTLAPLALTRGRRMVPSLECRSSAGALCSRNVFVVKICCSLLACVASLRFRLALAAFPRHHPATQNDTKTCGGTTAFQK